MVDNIQQAHQINKLSILTLDLFNDEGEVTANVSCLEINNTRYIITASQADSIIFALNAARAENIFTPDEVFGVEVVSTENNFTEH